MIDLAIAILCIVCLMWIIRKVATAPLSNAEKRCGE